MQVEVSSRKGKRDLTTLDLLSGCSTNLHSPLDLNLLPDDGHEPPPARPLVGNQSSCTIDEVKRALERVAQRDSRGCQEAQLQKPPSTDVVVSPSPASSPSSSSHSSSVTTAPSMKRRRTAAAADEESDGCEDTGAAVLVAAGCAACLSYVLTAKGNPRCPRCQSQVQLTAVPPPETSPGIDLNCAL